MNFLPRAAAALALLLCAASSAIAGIAVPAGAHLSLNGGRLDLAMQDLRVDGSLSLDSGAIATAGSIRFGGSAQADLGTGLIELLGDWENRGQVAAGSSRVHFLDGVSESALLGSTTFAEFALLSAAGKRYRFESGSTQAVTGLLRIEGTAAQPIQADVTQPGVTAFLNLLASGSQAIVHVGVSDVHATGQPLAPTQHNEGGRGNAKGWFGSGSGPDPARAVPAPTLSTPVLLVLAVLLAGIALLAYRRTRLPAHESRPAAPFPADRRRQRHCR